MALFMPFIKSLFGTRLRWPRPSLDTTLVGPRLELRVGDPIDWRDWRNLRNLSRNFLVPWEPAWIDECLSHDFFCGNLRRQWREWREGTGYAFLVFKEKALIGGITLNDVQRGVAQKGTLGYWIGHPYAGQGYMSEATRLLCDFAFEDLKLNRIEASCLPHNEASKRLLTKLEFTEEGYARSYLRINGKWEDHLLWGKSINQPN